MSGRSRETTAYARQLGVLLIAIFMTPPLSASEDEGDPLWVSIINLIASPDLYDRKKVFVSGWVSFGVEDRSICLVSRPASSKDCLWLEFSDAVEDSVFGQKSLAERRAILEANNGKSISLHGVFDADLTGHFGGWSGGLRQISDLFVDE